MNNYPNIFNYATSELSQDAVIAWLLAWASPEQKRNDEQLHLLGKKFLQTLLDKDKIQNIQLNDDYTLEVKTQYYKIDVFGILTINKQKVAIIIEDKTFTANHSNQLRRYKELVEKQGFKIITAIYFKTGFQHSFENIINEGYFPYTIKDFSKVLQYGVGLGIKNNILTSYYLFLKQKEEVYDKNKNDFDKYKNLKVNDWNWWSFVGFFHDNKPLLNAGWTSVANNREPMLAFWFGGKELHFNDIDSNKEIILTPYIDVVHTNNKKISINFRLGLNNNAQINNRNRNYIYNNFSPFLKANQIEHKRPVFRKSKETLLLAQTLEIKSTIMHYELIDLLKKYEYVLHEFINKHNASFLKTTV